MRPISFFSFTDLRGCQFTLTQTLLEKFERCQRWFLKHVFYVPEFAPKRLLLKLSRLNAIESEIALKKLLFLGRLINRQK